MGRLWFYLGHEDIVVVVVVFDFSQVPLRPLTFDPRTFFRFRPPGARFGPRTV